MVQQSLLEVSEREHLQRLEENLQQARTWRERAAADFEDAIVANPSNGLDRADRLKETSRKYTRAVEAMNRALQQYNDFVVRRNPGPEEAAVERSE